MANRIASINVFVAVVAALTILICGLLKTTAAYVPSNELELNEFGTNTHQRVMGSPEVANFVPLPVVPLLHSFVPLMDREILEKIEEFLTCVVKIGTSTFTTDLETFSRTSDDQFKKKVILETMITNLKKLLKNPLFASCVDILPSNSTTVASLSTHCALLMMILFCARLCFT